MIDPLRDRLKAYRKNRPERERSGFERELLDIALRAIVHRDLYKKRAAELERAIGRATTALRRGVV